MLRGNGNRDHPTRIKATVGGEAMWKVAILGLISSCATSTWAGAQGTLDVAKITCDQFSGYKFVNPDKIAIWLSGYYNGKLGNTIIDAQTLDENSNKLLRYCLNHPQTKIMDAVEESQGPGNH
jgi:acid stress chaperone HdeB